MEQIIRYKIFKAKSDIAEVQARENKWFGDDSRYRIYFGLTAAVTIIAFIVSLFFVDDIAYVFLIAFSAFLISVLALDLVLMRVNDSIYADIARYHLRLGEAREDLIEYTLDARVHEGAVRSSGAWNEFIIERDDAFEKIMVRIVDNGENEAVEMKPFVNG